MPGVKDTVSMEVNGEKKKVQKRLLLCGLKELHESYWEKNRSKSSLIVSFSVFSQLRPKICILLGKSGTHCVCVCTIHQNVKMMLDAIDLKKLTEKKLSN